MNVPRHRTGTKALGMPFPPAYQHHDLACDFLVAGGGLAGVCAALAAARNGARVILVQDRSVLGGNASSEVRMHVVGADCHGDKPGARETGIIEELRLEDAARNPHRSFSQWDLLLYEKVKLEPNITLLLDTDCIDCEMAVGTDGRSRIVAVNAVRRSTEDLFRIEARYFADCTGDGGLGASAGADHQVGRESRSAHGESLALETADRQTLGSSILLTARRHATPQKFIAPSWVRSFGPEDFRYRKIGSNYEYGFWWSEWGGQLDTIKDNEKIRHELLRIALGVWAYIKNSGHHPDSAHWALDWVGAIPGKRESRRFLGPHVLTQHDLENGALFDDRVAYGGWWIDLHPPSGVDAPIEYPCAHHHVPGLYTIPLRCYHSRNIANLFFAGRNISATHVAFGSTRVMATCAIGGQAIGTAAALWLRAGGTADISAHSTPENISVLQQTLLRDDAYIPALAASAPADLARVASISADSEQAHHPALAVVDGIGRDLRADFGPWSSDSAHHWRSARLPARLVLEWAEPVRLSELHLVFDTGLQRELILSPSDGVTSKVVRGPQPETVGRYRITFDDATVADIMDNHLRKRIHPVNRLGRRLVIDILATHGVPEARIFEVRAYGTRI